MPRSKDPPDHHFEGFENPTTTPVPDVVFDQFLSWLGEAELKALLYIIRRTFGFKKDRDQISFNQFLRGITTADGRVLDQGCGVRSRTTLSTALKSLEAKGIVKSDKGVDERGENVTTVYSLHFKNNGEGRGVVRNPYHRSTGNGPPVVRQTYPQQTVRQETVEQQTELSSKGPNSFNLGEHTASRFSKTKVADFENKPDPDLTRRPIAAGASGFKPIGNLISLHKAQQLAQVASERPVAEARSPRRDTKRGKAPQATDWIRADIERYSDELHDLEHTPQNIGQAARLFATSGLSEAAFCQLMGEARSITKGATIRKRAIGPGGEIGFRNKMPYFFKVLRDLLGLKEQQTKPGGELPGHA
jgi:hypothetical protein